MPSVDSVDGRTVAQPMRRQWMDVRENVPDWFVCWTVGWREVLFAWREPYGQP